MHNFSLPAPLGKVWHNTQLNSSRLQLGSNYWASSASSLRHCKCLYKITLLSFLILRFSTHQSQSRICETETDQGPHLTESIENTKFTVCSVASFHHSRLQLHTYKQAFSSARRFIDKRPISFKILLQRQDCSLPCCSVARLHAPST